MYKDFSPVIIFTIMATVLVALPLILQSLLSPKSNKGGDKLIPYECGELPEGSAWVKFNIRFYIIALSFLIFDVEVMFMYPWAVVFKDLGFHAFVDLLIFITVLAVGYIYVWGWTPVYFSTAEVWDEKFVFVVFHSFFNY